MGRGSDPRLSGGVPPLGKQARRAEHGSGGVHGLDGAHARSQGLSGWSDDAILHDREFRKVESAVDPEG